MPHFLAYGLCVEADLSIPGLLSAPPALPTDLHVWLESPSSLVVRLRTLSQLSIYVSQDQYQGRPIVQVWRLGEGEGFRFRYADGIEFVLDSAGTEVGVTWPSDMTLEDAAAYLVGPILSFVLRLQGVVCLHASAVAVRGRAAAFLGPPSAGKSTLAATFAQRQGIAVLSDDVVALVERDRQYWVHPGYPRVNLWADSAEAIFGSAERLPLITRGWEKRFVDLASISGGFQSSPVPLGALYVLEGNSPTLREPRIEPLTGRDSLVALVANTSVNYILDRSMRAREFEFLGNLISRVPMRQVTSSRLQDLDSLVTAILADWETLRT